MKVGMKTRYITEEELTFSLTATIYHDGEFDIEEVKQRIIKALSKDRLECRIEEMDTPINSCNMA